MSNTIGQEALKRAEINKLFADFIGITCKEFDVNEHEKGYRMALHDEYLPDTSAYTNRTAAEQHFYLTADFHLDYNPLHMVYAKWRLQRNELSRAYGYGAIMQYDQLMLEVNRGLTSGRIKDFYHKLVPAIVWFNEITGTEPEVSPFIDKTDE